MLLMLLGVSMEVFRIWELDIVLELPLCPAQAENRETTTTALNNF
jgi:hypothetical protein